MAVVPFLNSKTTPGKANTAQEGLFWVICAVASTVTCILLFKTCVADSLGSDYGQLICAMGAGALGLFCCLYFSPLKDDSGKKCDSSIGEEGLHALLSSSSGDRKEAFLSLAAPQGDPAAPREGVVLCGLQKSRLEEASEVLEKECIRVEGLGDVGIHEEVKVATVDFSVNEDKGTKIHSGPSGQTQRHEGAVPSMAYVKAVSKDGESNGRDCLSLGLGLAKFVSPSECVSEILDDTLGSPLSEYGSDDDLDIGGNEPGELVEGGSSSGQSSILLSEKVESKDGAAVQQLADMVMPGVEALEMRDVGGFCDDGAGFAQQNAVVVEAGSLSEPGSLIRSRGSATSSSSGSGSLTGLGRGARRQFAGFLEEFWSGVFDLHGKPAGPLDINEWLKQAHALSGGASGVSERAAVGSGMILGPGLQKTIPANMRTTGLLGGARDDYRLSVDRDMIVNAHDSGLDGACGGAVRNWHQSFVASGLEWGADSPRQRGLGLCDAEGDAPVDTKRALMRSPHGSDEAGSPERLGSFVASNGGLHLRQTSGSFEKGESDWVMGHAYANQGTASQHGRGSFLHHDMTNINSALSAAPTQLQACDGRTASWEVASSAYDSSTGGGFRPRPSGWREPFVNYEQNAVGYEDHQLRLQSRMRNWEESGGPSGTGMVRQLSPEKHVEQGWEVDLWRTQTQVFPQDKDLEGAARFHSSTAVAPMNVTASMRMEQPRHPENFRGPGRDSASASVSFDRFGNVHSHSLWSCQPHEQLFPSVTRVPGAGPGPYGREPPPSYCAPGMRPVDGHVERGQMNGVTSYQTGRVSLTRRAGGIDHGTEMRESPGLRDGWYVAQKSAQYHLSLEEEGRHGSWTRASSEMHRSSQGSWHGREAPGGSMRVTQPQPHHHLAVGGMQAKDREVAHPGRHVSVQSSQGQVIFQKWDDVLKALRTCITACLKLEGSEWLFRTGCGPDEELVSAIGSCVQARHLLHERESGLQPTVVPSEPKMGCGSSCAWGPGIMVSFGVWCVRRVLELSRLESRPELWGKYTYVLNHLQGILEPAFLRPRVVGKVCMCLTPRGPNIPNVRKRATGVNDGGDCNRGGNVEDTGLPSGSGSSSSGSLRGGEQGIGRAQSGDSKGATAVKELASKFLEIIKDVEQAVASRKGRTGTAAGDVAFPKGKENLASVLKRYKRRLANKSMGGGNGVGTPAGSTSSSAGGGGGVREGRAGSSASRGRGGSYNAGLVGHSLG